MPQFELINLNDPKSEPVMFAQTHEPDALRSALKALGYKLVELPLPQEQEQRETFKCPHCGTKLTYVFTTSEICQTGYLNGAEVVDYDAGDIGSSIKITCPECLKDLTEQING